MIPKLPFRTTDELRAEADRILAEHHSGGEIPIPIEQIVEAGFGLDIIPIRGFQARTNVEGGLSADLTSILVDERVMEKRITRYRFTLAHELGHFILHREQISALDHETLDDWKSSIQAIAPKVYGSMEWQAYELAGLILVPREPLLREYQSAAARARAHNLDLETLTDYGLGSVASWIGDAFQVSADVISRRLRREGLAP